MEFNYSTEESSSGDSILYRCSYCEFAGSKSSLFWHTNRTHQDKNPYSRSTTLLLTKEEQRERHRQYCRKWRTERQLKSTPAQEWPAKPVARESTLTQWTILYWLNWLFVQERRERKRQWRERNKLQKSAAELEEQQERRRIGTQRWRNKRKQQASAAENEKRLEQRRLYCKQLRAQQKLHETETQREERRERQRQRDKRWKEKKGLRALSSTNKNEQQQQCIKQEPQEQLQLCIKQEPQEKEQQCSKQEPQEQQLQALPSATEAFEQNQRREKDMQNVEGTEQSDNWFERGLEPEAVLNATEVSNEILLLIKWKGTTDVDLVPAKIAYEKCPQLVIKFYEKFAQPILCPPSDNQGLEPEA